MSSLARVSWIAAATAAIFALSLGVGAGAQVGVAFLYAAPIALASWWFGRRGGAIVVVASLLLYAVGDLVHPVEDFALALALRALVFVAVVVLVSLFRTRLVDLEHSAEELEAIRAALAPPSLPDLADVDAAAAFVPSELGVSGDFYLLTNGPDGSTVAIVGDVVGHGPRAARLATFVRARFAALAAGTSNPAELLMDVNRALAERPRRRRALVSAACVRFRSGDSSLTWARAGHPLPLRLPGLEELEPAGGTLLLGVEEQLQLSNGELRLDSREGVVIYTDGATDLRRAGTLLGPDGLSRLLAPLAGLPAKSIAARAQRELLAWADEPIRDDLCLLVLRPKAPLP